MASYLDFYYIFYFPAIILFTIRKNTLILSSLGYFIIFFATVTYMLGVDLVDKKLKLQSLGPTTTTIIATDYVFDIENLVQGFQPLEFIQHWFALNERR